MRNKSIISLVFVILCLAVNLQGQTKFDLESGFVFAGYSDARIPGDTGTLFSLTDDLNAETPPFVRIRVTQNLGKKHSLSVLYAPLTVKSEGTFDDLVNFEGINFPADEKMKATYRFDSYRLTYRYDFVKKPMTEFGIGFTAKIRDAEISLSGGGLSAKKSNTGFVPILNFKLNHTLNERFSLLFEGDALAAPQGRAEDIYAGVRYKLADWAKLKVGYRLLEGGADNDEVYNFALFHYATVGFELGY